MELCKEVRERVEATFCSESERLDKAAERVAEKLRKAGVEEDVRRLMLIRAADLGREGALLQTHPSTLIPKPWYGVLDLKRFIENEGLSESDLTMPADMMERSLAWRGFLLIARELGLIYDSIYGGGRSVSIPQ